MRLCRAMLIAAVLGFIYSAILLALIFPWAAFALVIVVIALAMKTKRMLDSCGSARWADFKDCEQAGMIGAKEGLILGWIPGSKRSLKRAVDDLFDKSVSDADACERFIDFSSKKNQAGALVKLPNAVHTAVFAPTGVGKGVSCILPFLLTCEESVVCIDIKGENYKISCDARRKMQHRVIALDPFRVVTQTPDTLNPLSCIDPDSPTALDDCFDLANALVIRTGKEQNNAHFLDQAESFIGGTIALTLKYSKNDRSLQAVRDLLCNPLRMAKAIEVMCISDAWDGMLQRIGHSLQHAKDKELASTMTTCNRFLRWLDSPAMLGSTRTSSFDPHDLTRSEPKTDVFCILPAQFVRSHAPLMRMWVGTLMRAMIRNGVQR